MGPGGRVSKTLCCLGTVLILNFKVFQIMKEEFTDTQLKFRQYGYLVLIDLKCTMWGFLLVKVKVVSSSISKVSSSIQWTHIEKQNKKIETGQDFGVIPNLLVMLSHHLCSCSKPPPT